MRGTQADLPYQSRHSMLAAGPACLARIKEDSRRAIDSLAGDNDARISRSKRASSLARSEIGVNDQAQ